MKNVFLMILVIVASVLQSMAQVPAYVPTDSLVGWFPFNGNTNDLSGKNNHLTNYGASLTNDRYNNFNSAYNLQSYSGIRRSTPISNGTNLTYAFWIYSSSGANNIIAESNSLGTSGFNCYLQSYIVKICTQGVTGNVTNSSATIGQNTWYFIAVTKQGTQFKLYINGIFVNQGTSNMNAFDTNTYFFVSAGVSNSGGFSGNIDDLGIWNRTLTQTEISALYNACAGNYITNHPNNQLVAIGSNTNFIASAPNNSIYQWQTNSSRLGWIDIPNNVAYSGSSDDTLSVQNVQLSNHLQEFRVITSLNNCLDTSLVATLMISDTCIETVNDTNHLVVYDTNIVNDTLIFNDTSYIVVYDTNIITDTLVFNDTNYLVIYDTNIFNDTLIFNDTSYIVVYDTNIITDTLVFNDTSYLVIYDTNIINDTNYLVFDTSHVIINDTNYVIVYDTNIIIINDTNHININDTNYVTINDTIYISVTDTLIIKVKLNITPPEDLNYIKMYPNPAKDHLTIDFGNYKSMGSYFLKIYDVSSHIIYYSPIYQQSLQLDLSTWTGKGIYFVQIIDAQTNVVETRKIVLE